MLAPYRAIFASPGTRGFSTAGLIARISPMGMWSIGIVTMLSELRGSYALAGAVTAVMLACTALLAPQTARLADRFGQTQVLVPTVATSVTAGLMLVLCAHTETPTWTLYVTASISGLTPNVGAMVRARWAELYRDEPRKLHTAYSLESVLDETCFIVGPIVAVGLSTTWFPEAGPLCGIALLTVGTALFAVQRGTEPPARPVGNHGGGSALRLPGLRILVLTFMTTGAIFGSVEVATVAFAEELGHKSAASVVLAVYALGSCLAGMVFGLLAPKGSPATRLRLGLTVMAASMFPLLLVGNLVVLGAALFVAGLTIAPTIVSSMAVVERLVPVGKLTEGMTWVMTGLVIGLASGSSLAGWVIDRADAATAYWIPVVAGGLALITVFLGWRWLRDTPERDGARDKYGHDEAGGREDVAQLGR